MSDEPDSKPEENLDLSTIPFEEPEEGVHYSYANVVNMNWTLTDVRLRFSELIQGFNDENPTWSNQHLVLLEKASITIPWLQAKILRNLLDGVVRSYEAANGELKLVKLAPKPD